jgi:hypothetical protein
VLYARFKIELAAEVLAKVKEATADKRRWYERCTEEAKQEKEQYKRWSASLNQIMTREDYRIVLGCLHPDRPDRSPEALGRACEIFKRLAESVKW